MFGVKQQLMVLWMAIGILAGVCFSIVAVGEVFIGVVTGIFGGFGWGIVFTYDIEEPDDEA